MQYYVIERFVPSLSRGDVDPQFFFDRFLVDEFRQTTRSQGGKRKILLQGEVSNPFNPHLKRIVQEGPSTVQPRQKI